jgi:hypothetical protein
MPTPDELFPDGDPADWPMCDGTFKTGIGLSNEKRVTATCGICGRQAGAVRIGEHLYRLNFHTAPRRFMARDC